MTERLSRRDFVKSVAVVGLATAGAGMLTACSEEAPAQVWDRETDVLVVGTGFAGMSAAIAAADAGANVLVIEKMPEKYEGGNSRVCAQAIWIPEDKTKAIGYFKDMATERHLVDIPDTTIDAYIDEMVKNLDFLNGTCGLKTIQSPAFAREIHAAPNADACSFTIMAESGMGQNAVWNAVAETAKSRATVEFIYDTPATALITDETGQVVGANATSGGATIAIKAKKGVILCCGGFEHNETMKANYLDGPQWAWGTPGNTGDGITMCQALGADFWHMNNVMGPLVLGIPVQVLGEDFAENGSDFATCSIQVSVPGNQHIWTDKYGKRFIDETREHQHGWGLKQILWDDSANIELPRVPLWVVFDQAHMAQMGGFYTTAGNKIGWAETHTGFNWSQGLADEIASGLVVTGATVEELATVMEVEPAVLKATLDRYNTFAAAGVDEDFGRPADTLAPLSGPFFATQLWPLFVNTDGGPRRDEKARILRYDGTPIPRLYSAGEFGSFFPHYYQGGGNTSECMATGRIAAVNAASDTAWDAEA